MATRRFRGGAGLPLAGGGGARRSSFIHQAHLRLNNAQIKALPSTGILFGLNPAADQILWPITIIAGCNSIAAPYTGITAEDSTLAISWMSATTPPTGFDAAYIGIEETGAGPGVHSLIGAAVHHVVLSTTQVFYAESWLAPSGSVHEQPSDIAGVDLGIYSGNGDGDFTGGHADNFMAVALTYYRFNINTGLLE